MKEASRVLTRVLTRILTRVAIVHVGQRYSASSFLLVSVSFEILLLRLHLPAKFVEYDNRASVF